MARVAIVFCLLLAVVVAGKKKPGLAGRIVGGRNTDITEVPYTVSLQYQKEHDCGGSIIGSKFIVTAAHCVYEGKLSDFTIRAGSSNHASGGETRKVEKIIMHPGYKDANFENDIAVLQLNKPLTFSNQIKSILLTDSEPKDGEEVLLSGWGVLQEKLKVASRTLQSVIVKVVNKEICKKIHQGRNRVTDKMFCAGVMTGGKDACQGDSGGPAAVRGKLAGIISWGVGCGHKNSPGVYTSVAKYRDWILDITRST